MENWSSQDTTIPTSSYMQHVNRWITSGNRSPNEPIFFDAPFHVAARYIAKQQVRPWKGQEMFLTLSIITSKTVVWFSRSRNIRLPSGFLGMISSLVYWRKTVADFHCTVRTALPYLVFNSIENLFNKNWPYDLTFCISAGLRLSQSIKRMIFRSKEPFWSNHPHFWRNFTIFSASSLGLQSNMNSRRVNPIKHDFD